MEVFNRGHPVVSFPLLNHMVEFNAFVLQGCSSFLFIAYLLWRFLFRKPQVPLPPGPRPKFLVGNVFDFPRSRPCLTYLDWAQRYGPIIYMDVAGKPTIILHTYKAATDLLDKRGYIYSDRPRLIMTGELVGLENNTSLQRFGPNWKKQRKLMNKALNAGMVRRDYSALQEYKTREYLHSLLQNPDGVLKNIGRMVGETMTEITYGAHEMDGVDFVDLSNEITAIISATLGRYLVDLLPILKMVPAWLPGAKFKRDAKKWRKTYFSSRDYLFNTIKLKKASNCDMPACYVSRLLEDIDRKEDQQAEEEAIKATSFTFYRAGTDSTKVTIESFLLAMTLYPDIQRKAQAEIDRVVSDRLPTVADTESLPYTMAVALETLRWALHTTIGVPHRLMEDDIYEGYLIPAGSSVYANIWAISHDAATYPDPDIFDPERFYSRKEMDPRDYAFGFGRRACPGTHLAMQGFFIMASSILWSFNIEPRKDLATFDKKPDKLFDFMIFSHPLPYDCNITPRSGTVEQRLSEAMALGKRQFDSAFE